MTHPQPRTATELLQAMVRIGSVNPALLSPGDPGRDGEARLVDYLERVCRAWGLPTRRLPVAGLADQLLVTSEVVPDPQPHGDEGNEADERHYRPWLLFDSHLDTVSIENMSIEPFAAELRDGRVWGRGTCDTKGTGAAMLWALRGFAAASNRANRIALLFSVDEEVSMRGIASFVKRDLPALGFAPAAAIVGEPTELRPVIAHQGCVRWTVTTHGQACHSSTPHDGRSAITAMTRVIQHLENHYIPSLTAEHPLTGQATCSINLIRGGAAPNIVPDTCTITLDRRTAPGEDHADVTRDFQSHLDALAETDALLTTTFSAQVDHPPLTTAYNPQLTAHLQTLLAGQNLPTLALGAPFATHAAVLHSAGIPSVVIGPGAPHPAHTRDEWVAVEEIKRGTTFYETLMRTPLSWAKPADG
ncbi:MAG: M20/M25/M40 family metallo-hydrolase [Planctomycetota bacterium]